MGAKLAEERQLASQHQLALQAQVSEAQAHIKVHRIIKHPEYDQTAMLFSAFQFKLSYGTLRRSPFCSVMMITFLGVFNFSFYSCCIQPSYWFKCFVNNTETHLNIKTL